MSRAGEMAIVLHTHMPYVEGGGEWPPSDREAFMQSPEGFGTWPFGEEWLWEAIATSYLPLLDVLGRAPITLSLTPVLCDQLEAAGSIERCVRFLDEIRPESHLRDIGTFRSAGEEALARELERSSGEYAYAARRLEALGPEGLLAALGAHASWTSAATHAVLPMIASDPGIALQVQTGTASHRRRFGDWGGGFWLPECAYAPWLDELLEQAGVRSTCVELTSLFGQGDRRHLTPLLTEAGPVLWPIDRDVISLVWGERGYPSASAYRDYHRLSEHHHRPWRNDGRPYDPEAAQALVAEHAKDFVARVGSRIRDGGLCVCALDTELLGHWWYEGVAWLGAVMDEAECAGLHMTTLDDALNHHEPAPSPPEIRVTSWGEGCDLRTWSGAVVADLAWMARSAELRVLACDQRPSDRALRELMALQSSDWAFMVSRDLAGEYPRERARGHGEALERALNGELAARLRNLAPEPTGWNG